MGKKKIVFGEWQLCPKCNGEGIVWKQNFDIQTSTIGWQPCDVCFGAKILARPQLKTDFHIKANLDVIYNHNIFNAEEYFNAL